MPGKEKKKIKIKNWQRQCASAYKHFHPLSNLILSLQFSLHFREKTFWQVQRENTQTPLFIFLSLHPTKHTPKKIFFLFYLQNFFHLISPPNKRILRVRFSHPWFELQTQVGTKFTLSHYFQPKKKKEKNIRYFNHLVLLLIKQGHQQTQLIEKGIM